RGLQTRKGKIRLRLPDHRARKAKAVRIAVHRAALYRRAARIGKAEEFCRLVESFSDRIVPRGADPRITADILDKDELGMSAGHEEEEIGKIELVGEP